MGAVRKIGLFHIKPNLRIYDFHDFFIIFAKLLQSLTKLKKTYNYNYRKCLHGNDIFEGKKYIALLLN